MELFMNQTNISAEPMLPLLRARRGVLEHGPDYFAAFVFDPDGHRIEAVVDARVSPDLDEKAERAEHVGVWINSWPYERTERTQ